MTRDDERRWRETADRVELAELMHRYAFAIDTARFDELREVFTVDASIDFGSVDQYVEGATGVTGIEAVVGWFRKVLAPFPDVLHFMTNHIVDFGGDAGSPGHDRGNGDGAHDTARIRTTMHVMHMPMGGVYEAQAVRTPKGWRFRRFTLDERHFEAAAARLRAHMEHVDQGQSKT